MKQCPVRFRFALATETRAPPPKVHCPPGDWMQAIAALGQSCSFADRPINGGKAPMQLIGQTLVNRLLTTYLAVSSPFG